MSDPPASRPDPGRTESTAAKDFGAQLRAARLERGLTQEELARRLDVTRSYVSHIEGGMTNPTLTTCERVAAALDCVLSVNLAPIA